MTAVDEARALLASLAQPLRETERVALKDALGRVLARPVAASRDDPPFARATMDGFAVRAQDTRGAPRALRVVGRVAAGAGPLPAVGPGQAAFVNTGAPLPPGADAVVPVEETRGEVEVLAAVAPGQNVLARGALAAPGDVVAGGRLTPERLAVCAAAGADPVEVLRRLRVTVLATGTELADAPGAQEIRNSNGPLLRALLDGCACDDAGAVPDDAAALERAFRRGLEGDAVVSTGGVSKGEMDLVPPVLARLGVDVRFHGVALQPGKPALFGQRGDCAVFALPGNPVSAQVCADLFVLPFLAARSGRSFEDALVPVTATLAAAARASPKRRRVLPAVLAAGRVEPLPWRGSADLYTAARANAYVVLEPGGDRPAGAAVPCLVPERHAASVLRA